MRLGRDIEEKLSKLPYPVALTAQRLAMAVQQKSDVFRTIGRLKDCFEATVKFCSAWLLAEYFESCKNNQKTNEVLVKNLLRPSLGNWITLLEDLCRYLIKVNCSSHSIVELFLKQGRAKKPASTKMLKSCHKFVRFRNDTIGHGAERDDQKYQKDVEEWLPIIHGLLEALSKMQTHELHFVTTAKSSEIWMGPMPEKISVVGEFRDDQIGKFVLSGPERLNLSPFVLKIEGSGKSGLCFYDSLKNYNASKKEVSALSYDSGEKIVTSNPIADLELRFSEELLARLSKREQKQLETVNGSRISFEEIVVDHAHMIGREFVVRHVEGFLSEKERGILVIEGDPGKGKTTIIANLVDNVFGSFSPKPVVFFYRRTAGVVSPDDCIQTLYSSLLEVHGIVEPDDSGLLEDPENVFKKLNNLLHEKIGPRLSPSRPQLILIDGLDEAETSSTGRTAFECLPENIPEGVYVVVTTRKVKDRNILSRRKHLTWFDLDSPDLVHNNLADGKEYVRHRLEGTDYSPELVAELARVGQGNFLVLKLITDQFFAGIQVQNVGEFVRRLATNSGNDQLGFIYEDFWNRISSLLNRTDLNLLCDVVGVFVTARVPVTSSFLKECLSLRSGDLEFAMRHVKEYVHEFEVEIEGQAVTFYRFFHASFNDFVRSKIRVDQRYLENKLADYCLRFSEFPQGFSRQYALRFVIQHLRNVKQWDSVERLLTDIEFLEARVSECSVAELANDFADVLSVLPLHRKSQRTLRLIRAGILRDIQFLISHPHLLFQCLWNSCWWYDCPQLARFDSAEEECDSETGITLAENSQPLSSLLEKWRSEKAVSAPNEMWIRSLLPPQVALNLSSVRLCAERNMLLDFAWSRGGRVVAVVYENLLVVLWNAKTGRKLSQFDAEVEDCKPENDFSLSFSDDGESLLRLSVAGKYAGDDDSEDLSSKTSGWLDFDFPQLDERRCVVSSDGRWRAEISGERLSIENVDSGFEFIRNGGGNFEIGDASLKFSPDERLLACVTDDGALWVWDLSSIENDAKCRGDFFHRDVWDVSVSPGGRYVVCRYHDGEVVVRIAESWQECMRVEVSRKYELLLSFSSSDWIQIVDGYGSVREFGVRSPYVDWRQARVQREVLDDLNDEHSYDPVDQIVTGLMLEGAAEDWLLDLHVWNVQVSSNEEMVAILLIEDTEILDEHNSCVELWRVCDEKLLWRIWIDECRVDSLRFSLDEKWLVSYGVGHEGIWDVFTGEGYKSKIEKGRSNLPPSLLGERFIWVWPFNTASQPLIVRGHEDDQPVGHWPMAVEQTGCERNRRACSVSQTGGVFAGVGEGRLFLLRIERFADS